VCAQLLGLLQQPGNLSSFTSHKIWADTQAAAACWLLSPLAPAASMPVGDLAAAEKKLTVECYTRLDCTYRLVQQGSASTWWCTRRWCKLAMLPCCASCCFAVTGRLACCSTSPQQPQLMSLYPQADWGRFLPSSNILAKAHHHTICVCRHNTTSSPVSMTWFMPLAIMLFVRSLQAMH
jgi:hypothetical protein